MISHVAQVGTIFAFKWGYLFLITHQLLYENMIIIAEN